MSKLAKPGYVTMSDADWQALTEAQQQATLNLYALQKAKGIKSAAPTSIIFEAPAPESPDNDGKELTPDQVGIRNWSESIVTSSGKTITGERIRNCIIYQLDVRKDSWYTMRLTKGFVKAKAEKLDDDTPEDFVFEKDPLFREKKIRTEDGETMITKIERQPKNDAERRKIRERFGVNPQTVSYLAKKDCPKCGGSGVYSTSSYPNDPVYERLTESVECACSYE